MSEFLEKVVINRNIYGRGDISDWEGMVLFDVILSQAFRDCKVLMV